MSKLIIFDVLLPKEGDFGLSTIIKFLKATLIRKVSHLYQKHYLPHYSQLEFPQDHTS